jgi:pilus assembly protein CpaE
MNNRGHTLIVADAGMDTEQFRAAVPTGQATTLSLADGVERALSVIDASEPGLLIVGCAGPTESALELVGEARRRQSDCPIVVLYAGSPNGFMKRAFELGADDLIALPQAQDALAFALEKAITRRKRAGAGRSIGAMICIVGPKGGTGKTLTACNLAVALAKAGARPALVDVDLQFGDVGLALGLPAERTIYDLAVSGTQIDGESIGHYMTQHSSGASVLLAPLRPDQAGAIDADLLRKVYEALLSEYEFLIVDTPPAFTPEVIATIDASTHLCVVGMLDALSLKDTKLGLETLARMGRNLDAVTLVLNRADTSVGISQDDVTRILGRRPNILVPSDRAIPRAITDGQPIVLADERSGPAQAFAALADIYLTATGHPAVLDSGSAQPRRSRRSLLRKRTVANGTA